MVILPADNWVCIFVVVVWIRHPTQGATGGWVMPSLVFKTLYSQLCVSSHYLILPRVSSLVV